MPEPSRLYAAPGTVVRYHVPWEQGRDVMWCREGMAVARDSDGLLIDTYWRIGGHDYLKFVENEWFESVEVLGVLSDFRQADRFEDVGQYHQRDRLTVTSQHRLQRTEFIRLGAQPSYATRVRREVAKLRDARDELASAKRRLEWAEADLARILAERTPNAPADPKENRDA